jgi:hypothetical protein
MLVGVKAQSRKDRRCAGKEKTMKTKIIPALLLTAALLALAGCEKAEPNTESPQALLTSVAESTAKHETVGINTEIEPESPAEKEESEETPTEDAPDTTATPTEPDAPPTPQTPIESKLAVSNSPQTEPPKTEPDKSVTETPKQEEPTPIKPTESPKEPEPTVKPETEPPADHTPPPPEEKPKDPVQPSEPAFDVNYWVDYAKGYAQSLGLTLSSWAVECWDNPIPAAPHCTNLASDIQGYLNRYAKSGEVTDVWIWAESLGNNQYQIYIGYA